LRSKIILLLVLLMAASGIALVAPSQARPLGSPGDLTHIDSHDPGDYAWGVWGDGTYIYLANEGGGLHSYSVDGSGNLTHIDSDDPGDYAMGVWGDGDYIYLANDCGGLHSYFVDGSGNLIHIDSDDPGGIAWGVWGDGTYIYLANYGDGLHSYSVDGSGYLTHIDSDDPGGTAWGVWGDGNYIYLANYDDGLHSYSVDESGYLTHIDSHDPGGMARGVWGNGNYIYLANGSDGLHSYSVDGSGNLTHIDSDDPGDYAMGVWGDGNYVYLANGGGGLHSYSVDGSGNLTHIDSHDPGYSARSVWGDGTYIYLANDGNGLHSYSVEEPPTPTPTNTPTNTPTPTPTNTPTPTPYLAANLQNPQGTPVAYDLYQLNWPPSPPQDYDHICGPCVSYTVPYSYQSDYEAGPWFSNTSYTDVVCIGVTPAPTSGHLVDYGTGSCGWLWDSWDTGGRSADIVVGTVTPTPTSTPTPTPTPTPYVHAEAINPQGTPVTVWELGKLEHEETSRCNNCESFTDWIIASTGRILADSGQELGDEQSYDVALGDLDDDGDLDAFVANSGSSPANMVWLNDGTGQFTDSGQGLGNSYSQEITLGDLDGDDDLDAIVVNYNGNPIVWLNDGTGVFTTGQNIDFGTESLALGDVDADDDLDILLVSSSHISPANQVWLNDGTGVFTDSGQRLGDLDGVDVAFGDVDDDDDLDAFVINYTSPQKEGPDKVWLNDGTGVFTDGGQSIETNGNGLNVALADVDDDDDLDAFIVGELESTVWLNDGTGVFTDSGQTIEEEYWSYERVALGDLDNDGDPDAFLSKTGESGRCAVFTNDGTGVFTNVNQHTFRHCYSFGTALGDLNDDGYLDAFSVSAAEGWPYETPNQVFLNTFTGVYIVAYSNQTVIGVTPEPNTGWKPDNTAYYWDEMPGGGEHSASFIVVTPTPTPVSKPLNVRVRGEVGSRVDVTYIEIQGGEHPYELDIIASCYDCDEILNVNVSPYDEVLVRIYPPTGFTTLGVVADPDTGIESGPTYYRWYPLDDNAYSLQFNVFPPTPTPTPTPTPIATPHFGTDLFFLPLMMMNPIEFPAAPILPAFPELKWPDGERAPALPTLDLGDLPTLEPLVVPTIDFPPIPDFVPPEFPTTFTLHHEALQLPEVTLPNSLTIDAMIPLSGAPPITQTWSVSDIVGFGNLTLSAESAFNVTPLTTPVSLTISITPPTFPITFDLPTAISVVNTTSKTKQIHAKFSEATTKALALKATIVATTGDLDSIKNKTIAGKTAEDMADEMADGFDVLLSYLRGVAGIAIIGPSLAAVLVGLGWVAIVTGAKLLVKGTLSLIGILLGIWNRIPGKAT